jgi:uncharacterized DUF497 family protein
MEFGWDEAKSDTNLAVRGFGFDFAALIFEGTTLEMLDDRKDYGELRIRAIGEVDRLDGSSPLVSQTRRSAPYGNRS